VRACPVVVAVTRPDNVVVVGAVGVGVGVGAVAVPVAVVVAGGAVVDVGAVGCFSLEQLDTAKNATHTVRARIASRMVQSLRLKKANSTIGYASDLKR
jgi:hypothetical protein